MRLGLFFVIIRELGCKIIKYLIILYNTTNMTDSLSDGQTRQVFNDATKIVYKVTIPTGWVSNHQNQLSQLSSEYVWGDIYKGSPPKIQELPDDIKTQFGLNGPVLVQGRLREEDVNPVGAEERRRRMEGGKSKKQSARRRRRSSKARKARKARKSRKSRTTRRR